MAKTETLLDNFTTADSAKWSGYGSNPTVTSGQLSLTPTSSYPGIYSAVTYDLTSSYIMIQLVQAPNVGNGSTSVSMNVQASPNNTEEISIENNQIIFREKVTNTNSDIAIPYNAVTHKWLRIREAAGTVYWDTSADGTAWTNRRSKTSGIGSLTSVTINLFAGFWGTEPAPGVALLDNFNIVPAAAVTPGWVLGSLPFGATSGGTVLSRHYFDAADWLWNPIPANPAIDTNSAPIVSSLAANGAQRVASLHDYSVSLQGPNGISAATPRYDVAFVNDPAWGPDPNGTDTVPIPNGTPVPPGTDGHLSIADPTTDKVYSMWQAAYAGTWGASWGSMVDLHGDGLEIAPDSATASRISPYAATIRASEIAAGEIPHALFFSTDMAHTTAFRYPASKTDGDNTAGVPVPIPEGARVQLDPSIDVDAIPGITAGEKVVAKALQKYGAYCGDKGGARMAFAFEYIDAAPSPGQAYIDAGLAWDYFDMTHIPWSSLRVLSSWNGS